jgi:multiple sugar transport system permease protein
MAAEIHPENGLQESARLLEKSVTPPVKRHRIDEKDRFGLLLIAPAVIILCVFEIMPIMIGMNASFRNWTLYNPNGAWVGLQHYAYILKDPVFLKLVLPNTFLLIALSVSISLCLGLALAHLLVRRFFGRVVVQTFVLFPLLIAPVIASMIVRWIFNDQFGIATVVLAYLGFEPVSWLAERWPSFGLIVFTDIWLWTPWFTIILLAGLRGLPKEPYEAARIDAAGPWRIFTHVTLPMLRPVLVVCIVVRVIDCFRTFDQVWVITGGGPARTTEVVSTYAYTEAFENLNFARGTAAAVIGAVIIGLVSWVLYKSLNRFMEAHS